MGTTVIVSATVTPGKELLEYMGADIRNVGLQIEPGGFMQPLREHPGFGSILNRDRALTQPVDDPDRILNPCVLFRAEELHGSY